MNEIRDHKVVTDNITEMFGDVLAERNALRSELEKTEKRLKTIEDAIEKAYCDTFVLCWINVPLDVAPSVFQNELMKQQRELTLLDHQSKHLREAAEAAETLRAKAKELSSIQDGLYDTLWKTDNPTDRRTKAWKDHDVASRASNIAWHDFNNALRNIGLDVCESNSKSKVTVI